MALGDIDGRAQRRRRVRVDSRDRPGDDGGATAKTNGASFIGDGGAEPALDEGAEAELLELAPPFGGEGQG